MGTTDTTDDVARIRDRLRGVASDAAGQAWAKQRPWAPATHVWWEQGVPVVDLHDLGAGLARDAVRAALDGPLEVGAVVFVHGRGRRSGQTVLQGVVHKQLKAARADHPEGRWRTVGAGRTVWIPDPRRAPDWAANRWGPGVWLLWAGLGAAVVAGLGHAAGLW